MSRLSSAAESLTRGQQLTAYIAGTQARPLPAEILDAAKRALLDFAGVSIGAVEQPVVIATRRVAQSWNAAGNAQIFLDGKSTPAVAVLVNATMAHAMDYDDTHPGGTGHPSAPCWATALALAQHHGLSEHAALAGFVAGFEIMARLGGGGPPGVGRSLQRRGLHPTSVFGRSAAAAVACSMLALTEEQTAHALGAAATTAGGLVGSFGTDSKPFHAGKAAMDGILAAELAAAGFEAATHLYELRGGLLDAFIQNREVEVPPLDFAARWELLGNGFKPFACCRATQASTQAARTLAERVKGKNVTRVHARVHPNALVTAGKRDPRTPLEGKFSVPFCIALGLRGYRAVFTDFTDATMRDKSVMNIVPLVELEAVVGQAPHSAHLDVYLEGGEHLHADTDIVIGHPDNPMSWEDLFTKFEGLAEPIIGSANTKALYECVRNFDKPGSLATATELMGAAADRR
ncbi:MAG: 2-methylcitrate dehydratase [Betaproteobacteria bacterium]|nr:2-methylcitrate dehydratase [Betaproteobacteria bacterium]